MYRCSTIHCTRQWLTTISSVHVGYSNSHFHETVVELISSTTKRFLGSTFLATVTKFVSELYPSIQKELKQWRQRRHRGRHKSNSFRLAKRQLCTCITLFCTFRCRHCTTTTWKCLTSHFVEDVNTMQRLSSSFPELRYSLLEFISRKNCQHLAN